MQPGHGWIRTTSSRPPIPVNEPPPSSYHASRAPYQQPGSDPAGLAASLGIVPAARLRTRRPGRIPPPGCVPSSRRVPAGLSSRPVRRRRGNDKARPSAVILGIVIPLLLLAGAASIFGILVPAGGAGRTASRRRWPTCVGIIALASVVNIIWPPRARSATGVTGTTEPRAARRIARRLSHRPIRSEPPAATTLAGSARVQRASRCGGGAGQRRAPIAAADAPSSAGRRPAPPATAAGPICASRPPPSAPPRQPREPAQHQPGHRAGAARPATEPRRQAGRRAGRSALRSDRRAQQPAGGHPGHHRHGEQQRAAAPGRPASGSPASSGSGGQRAHRHLGGADRRAGAEREARAEQVARRAHTASVRAVGQARAA